MPDSPSAVANDRRKSCQVQPFGFVLSAPPLPLVASTSAALRSVNVSTCRPDRGAGKTDPDRGGSAARERPIFCGSPPASASDAARRRLSRTFNASGCKCSLCGSRFLVNLPSCRHSAAARSTCAQSSLAASLRRQGTAIRNRTRSRHTGSSSRSAAFHSRASSTAAWYATFFDLAGDFARTKCADRAGRQDSSRTNETPSIAAPLLSTAVSSSERPPKFHLRVALTVPEYVPVGRRGSAGGDPVDPLCGQFRRLEP